MAFPRQKFRELVFQLLFSRDFSLKNELETAPVMMALLKTTRGQVKKAEAMVEEILAQKAFLDEKIRAVSEDYRLERISKAELNILRLGLFELFFQTSPSKVVLAEAIRLARKFGSENGSDFVNALLDQVYQKNKDGLAATEK
ncbi:MAG: transcription antitermination factor NusB [Parachlamydiales bacterium]|jgi:N utilization substance protein B